MDIANSAPLEENGSSTLGFPSISTSDFQFDHEKASTVLVEAVAKFLMTEDSKMRLILVDLINSHMMTLVSRKAREKGLDSNRFLTFVGDITKLRSSNGPACKIIATAANWLLEVVLMPQYTTSSAAGPDLERATKKVAETLNPGTSVAVQLPESSPLYINEGVTHVIHVLGPNMNPQRPNCLFGDYSEGGRILQSSYASLFQNFSFIARSTVRRPISKVQASRKLGGSSNDETGTVGVTEGAHQKPSKNAFSVLMRASKRNRDLNNTTSKIEEGVLGRNPQDTKRLGGWPLALHNAAMNPEQHKGVLGRNPQDRKRWGGWSLPLYNAAMNPEQHKDIQTILQTTDDSVVLHDKYPKAKRHILVVARRPGLDTLDNVRKEHLPLLRHIHSVGEEWAAGFLKEDPSLIFRLGYHAVPSMRQLHLHVVSQDFDPAFLKNQKHWNSFTTPFFLDSSDVLDQLEGEGQVQLFGKDSEMTRELRCHRCRSAHPNLPALKQHITKCSCPLANSSCLVTAESLGLIP